MSGRVLAFLDERKLELDPADAPAPDGHWRLRSDAESIAWLVLDKQGSSANTLCEAVLRQLDERLGEIETMAPRALVVRSAKPSGFVAGADITEFAGLADSGFVEERLRQGHAILDRLEKLPFPTMAIVHGYALGGGLELALACDYRIAIDGASFGFPEVMLGLHPGLGGTYRLAERIDPAEAMTLMLTGKTAHTKKAKQLGIVDIVTEERHVGNAVRAIAAGEIEAYEPGLKASAFALQPVRALAARQMRSKAAEKAPSNHYPAPHALIDLWEAHGNDRDAMQTGEIASFARLLTGETAQNLIRVYFLRETLKKLGEGESGIAHVHVIGAGAMGGEIAAWCAMKGLDVTLADIDNAPLGAAMKAAARLCDRKHLSGPEKRDALDRLVPDPKAAGLGKADLVIEAVPENPELKKKIYAATEGKMKQGAILASNTSSLQLEDLVSGVEEPSRFAGLHFFNPVSKLQLVEIVSHEGAAASTIERLRAFAGEIDRLPAPVKSAPGFLVNRALMPYLMEALVLMDEGVGKEAIDGSAEAFGMPMGPVEVADQVGLDICLHVAESLKDKLDKPMADIPRWLREKVENGDLGRKSGKGFYAWEDGKAQKSGSDNPPEGASGEDLRDRLILPMLDACVECLGKGLVDNEDVVDAAMIFATGFAPFRGGPMHYARDRGIGAIIEKLNALAAKHGERFRPDAHWSTLEKNVPARS